jgi:pyruvate dehydrogenase E1 component beta subunit
MLVPIGKARVARAGTDVTIVSYSIGAGVALDAAETLAGEGIEAEVIDLRTLRPARHPHRARQRGAHPSPGLRRGRLADLLDLRRTCRSSHGAGLRRLDAPVIRVTNEDVPMPYAANLEKAALLKVEDVVEAVKKVLAIAPERRLRGCIGCRSRGGPRAWDCRSACNRGYRAPAATRCSG